MPKTGYEKQKAAREKKLAAGMKRVELWAWPQAIAAIRAAAKSLNSRAKKDAEK